MDTEDPKTQRNKLADTLYGHPYSQFCLCLRCALVLKGAPQAEVDAYLIEGKLVEIKPKLPKQKVIHVDFKSRKVIKNK